MDALVRELTKTGARVEVQFASGDHFRVGSTPSRASILFRDDRGRIALSRGDHLALAEAYVDGGVIVEGELSEAFRAIDALHIRATAWGRLRSVLRSRLMRSRSNQRLVRSHYDRPFEFFRPWLGTTRSYTHGIFATPSSSLDEAQRTKLGMALEQLDLDSGRVLDVGCGWGSFMEYAGSRGVWVEGVTLSGAQAAFVSDLISRKDLSCGVIECDFFDLRNDGPYDGAVLMGSLEHLIDTRRVARFLAANLRPGARVWADFCAQASDTFAGAFIDSRIWPGAARYVSLSRLIGHLEGEGFEILEVADDTNHYGATVAAWADALDANMGELGLEFGSDTRAFQLLLHGSRHYFATRQTLAYHVLAEKSRNAASSL